MNPSLEYEIRGLLVRRCRLSARHKCLVFAQHNYGGNWKEEYLRILEYFGLKSKMYGDGNTKNPVRRKTPDLVLRG